jgi:hypothetical protein
MVRGQHHDQGFEPNRLDLERGVDAPRREQQAKVELPSTKRRKRFMRKHRASQPVVV